MTLAKEFSKKELVQMLGAIESPSCPAAGWDSIRILKKRGKKTEKAYALTEYWMQSCFNSSAG